VQRIHFFGSGTERTRTVTGGAELASGDLCLTVALFGDSSLIGLYGFRESSETGRRRPAQQVRKEAVVMRGFKQCGEFLEGLTGSRTVIRKPSYDRAGKLRLQQSRLRYDNECGNSGLQPLQGICANLFF
jgi:hypothetical protein